MSKKTQADLSVQIGPVCFKNPVFIASGICGYGAEYSPLVPIERLGGVVTKTITIRPRLGNPPPRIHELPAGALNSIGLEIGVDQPVRPFAECGVHRESLPCRWLRLELFGRPAVGDAVRRRDRVEM